MAYRGDAEFLKIVGGQRRQQRRVDRVVREGPGILAQPQALQPRLDVQRPASG